MKKLSLFILSGLLMASGLMAQTPKHPKYVKRGGDSEKFYNRYAAWQPGKAYSADPAASEDEEFFISRVKIRERFTNAATQVDPTLSAARKFLWWCPIGELSWNATPAYYFDSEPWNHWSYLDHYGNWTADFIRMPAAMLDICHKNGIGSSVVAAVGFASTVSPTDGGSGQNFQAITDGGGEKLARYLRYYGIDGIGFNSEFNFSSVDFNNSFQKTIGDAFKKGNTDEYWPNMANCWYSITDNNGRLGNNWDALTSGNQNWFHNNGTTVSNFFFLNYNWGASHLTSSVNIAKSFAGRSSYDVYAGIDFQGSGSRPLNVLKSYEISVGIWGAHNMNMPYESRIQLGSAPKQTMSTYLRKLQVIFAGGSLNPLNTIPFSNNYGYNAYMPDFGGFGKLITARSALKFDLAKEPFFTYFNLGNGPCFRDKGAIAFPGEWYNIGVQDYMPTWQFWFSNKFRGQKPTTDLAGTNLKAEFTWDDAWFGGSSLKISGATTKEYLQLFKTQIRLANGDQIVVRYKVKSGSGSMFLTASAENAEGTEVSPRSAVTAKSVYDKWNETIIGVGSNPSAMLPLNGKTLALLGLRFENTSADFEILIGEVSIKRPTAKFPTPAKPTITASRLLGANFKGIDFKLIYKMADRNPSRLEDPIYNSDVNTSFFKVWYQQEGKEPLFCVTTTSWAAYVVGAAYDLTGSKRFRCGVSAVGVTGIDSESDIAWSDYIAVDEEKWNNVEGLVIDKPVIKANEKFTIKFEDPTHAIGNFEIIHPVTQAVVKSATSVTSFTTELAELGVYDVRTTSEGKVDITRGLISISPKETGAMPIIGTMNLSASSVEENQEITASATTEREGEGTASRGLRVISPNLFRVPADEIVKDASYSVALWVNPAEFNCMDDGIGFINRCRIDNPLNGPWMSATRGDFWIGIRENDTYWKLGEVSYTTWGDGKDSDWGNRWENPYKPFCTTGYALKPGTWTHLVFSHDKETGMQRIFFNGKKVIESQYNFKAYVGGPIYVGLETNRRTSFDGLIDEFQVWTKAIGTEEEAKSSMMGYKKAPSGLAAYYTFETKNDDNTFTNEGTLGTESKFRANVVAIQSNKEVAQPVEVGESGCSLISGTLPITAVGKWEFAGASEATPKGQSLKVTYDEQGTYDISFVLTNGWGADKSTKQVVITPTTGINDVEGEAGLNIYPNPFFETATVLFSEGGDYTVSVFTESGQQVVSRNYSVNAKDIRELSFQAEKGTYYVTIIKEGKALKSFKVIKQ